MADAILDLAVGGAPTWVAVEHDAEGESGLRRWRRAGSGVWRHVARFAIGVGHDVTTKRADTAHGSRLTEYDTGRMLKTFLKRPVHAGH